MILKHFPVFFMSELRMRSKMDAGLVGTTIFITFEAQLISSESKLHAEVTSTILKDGMFSNS